MIYLLILLSFPSTFGGKGIYRIKSADIEWLLDARSILIINIDAEGYRYDYTDTSIDYASGRISIGYTPSKWFEGYTLWRVHGEGHAEIPVNSSEFEGDLGDLDLGAKAVFKKMKNSYLGGDFALTLPIGRDRFSNDAFIFYPKLLGTFDLGDYWWLFPLRAHVNIGVPIGRQGLGDHFPLTLGFAWELPSRFFTYFMEVSRNHERDWYWRFSPGLRFHPFYRLGLVMAADLGLVREPRLLGANIGISLNSSLTKEREVMPTGNIAGEIRDKNTNEPIAAQVRILEIDEAIKSDDAYGVYKLLGIPRGVYTLKVEAENYVPQIRVIALESNQATVLNFLLARSGIKYEGVVLNSQTGQPVDAANVNIEGRTVSLLKTNLDGAFSEILMPGEYAVKVNKENYVLYTSQFTMTEDRYDTIMLKPVEVISEVPEAIVYFDVDDANIRDNQKPILDTIAEFLKSHPRVRCELRGHADPSGDMDYNLTLSLARANSVMDYFEKVHGIEKDRISTLAFSKTKLIKENKELSRRVEIFLVK